MKQRSRLKSTSDALRMTAEKLRLAATRPNIYGYVPHDRQVAFHSSEARLKLFAGGNRSGKTVGGACESAWWLTGKHPYRETPRPPVRGRCVTVDFIEGLYKIVLPELSRWLPPSELIDGSWERSWDKNLRTLTLANDSFIEFMSYEQELEKFAGTSRHFTWFDEEPPKDIYTECLLRLLDVGGSLWITMTPVEGMTWTYEDIYEKQDIDPNVFVVEVDTTQNPFINEGEIAILLAGLSEDERKARIHGQYVQIGGRIYPMFKRDIHVIDDFIPPEEWLHIAAMDHGFNNPTAWLWSAVNPDGDVFIYDEHYESGQVVRYHAERVHERNAIHKRMPAYYIGDPAIKQVNPITGTSVQLEYVDHGVPILPANNEVRGGINRVAHYLTGVNDRPKLYICKKCTNLTRELAKYRWSVWASKKMISDRNKKEEPHKKDDHAADALRYLIASRPENDTGTEIPEILGPRGASIPVDGPDRLVSSGWHTASSSLDYDPVLGAEY